MIPRHPLRYLFFVPIIGLVAASCGDDGPDAAGDTPAATAPAEEGSEEEEGLSDEFEFGDPVDSADASRVIEITALDNFTFEPASVAITAGDTVTFRVTNVGVIPHDFTLGDSATQDSHDAEMAEMVGMEVHDESNAIGLEPGETKEMTWHFTEAGEILFGCHVPGHYAAGMKGDITIEA